MFGKSSRSTDAELRVVWVMKIAYQEILGHREWNIQRS